MGTEQQIKEWAEAGWTRADVAQALGLPLSKFGHYQNSIGFKWPQGRSIGQRRYLASRQQKGNPEQGKLMHEAYHALLPRYTVNGVTGTIRELAMAMGVVRYASVYERVRKGMSIEDALFTPRQDKRGRRKADTR
jgi:hypothetical protein